MCVRTKVHANMGKREGLQGRKTVTANRLQDNILSFASCILHDKSGKFLQ